MKGGSKLTLKGPLTFVVEDFQMLSNSKLVFDPSGGEIELYAKHDFVLQSNADVKSLSESALDVTLFLGGNNFGSNNGSSNQIEPGDDVATIRTKVTNHTLELDAQLAAIAQSKLTDPRAREFVTLAPTTDMSQSVIYNYLFWGTFLFAVANGTLEAVSNPLVATLFPTKRTHYLNILHASWPAGLVLGGVIGWTLDDQLGIHWKWQLSLYLVPTVIYGLMFLGQHMPKSEASKRGLSLGEMLKDVGILGGAIVFGSAMFLAGLEGQPVDVFRYYEEDGVAAENLVASLQEQLRRYRAYCDIDVALRHDGHLQLTDRVAGELYQIACEGLSNIHRHTQAKKGYLDLRAGPEEVRLAIANERPGARAPFTPRTYN